MHLEEFLSSGTLLSLGADRLLVGWGKRTWSQTPQSHGAPNFYYPDFFLKTGKPWFTHEKWDIITIFELQDQNSILQLKLTWNSLDDDFFALTFEDLQQRFKNGELQKAVPYIFERTDEKMSNFLLRSTLNNVLKYASNYPAHVYGMWNEEEGILGATPELLFDYDTTIKTVACAGTYRTGLQRTVDEKTLYEHQLVVEGIQQSLKPFGDINISDLTFQEFASLGHLITAIEVHPSKPVDFLQLVHALHPTPALGAFPKEKGFHWLENYQTHIQRGRFGAPAGYLHEGKSRCVVAIRNVQWTRKGMSLGAGCGIVSSSSLNQEWKEVQLKLKAIKGILGL